MALALPVPPLASTDVQIGLRPWGLAPRDADSLAAAWAEEDIARWTSVPVDHGVDDAQRWIDGEALRRQRHIAIDLVIHPLTDPATVLGEVGLVFTTTDLSRAELGYWLHRSARHVGVAAAATACVVDWALDSLSLRQVFACTASANPGAGRVAAAAGLTLLGTVESGSEVWARNATGTVTL